MRLVHVFGLACLKNHMPSLVVAPTGTQQEMHCGHTLRQSTDSLFQSHQQRVSVPLSWDVPIEECGSTAFSSSPCGKKQSTWVTNQFVVRCIESQCEGCRFEIASCTGRIRLSAGSPYRPSNRILPTICHQRVEPSRVRHRVPGQPLQQPVKVKQMLLPNTPARHMHS